MVERRQGIGVYARGKGPIGVIVLDVGVFAHTVLKAASHIVGCNVRMTQLKHHQT